MSKRKPTIAGGWVSELESSRMTRVPVQIIRKMHYHGWVRAIKQRGHANTFYIIEDIVRAKSEHLGMLGIYAGKPLAAALQPSLPSQPCEHATASTDRHGRPMLHPPKHQRR